jgi:hypothetical protein
LLKLSFTSATVMETPYLEANKEQQYPSFFYF